VALHKALLLEVRTLSDIGGKTPRKRRPKCARQKAFVTGIIEAATADL
jgi:hypothetical protein